MLMHARPSKSSTTRPPPIAVVRFRSMQHKQLEVWQRHCDCGAVDLPTASGISQESSVSVVRKNTKAHQRNSTREMGSKRKSSIESWRKISSPISIHQSIFSNFLSARVDIVSISLRSMSRRTFLHRKALSFSPRNDKVRVSQSVSRHTHASERCLYSQTFSRYWDKLPTSYDPRWKVEQGTANSLI